MSRPEILTFGCRLNTVESESMRRLAEEAGVEDAVIVNTCAVTAEAVRQARQAIRRARRENPDARIVVTGCAAQTEPATFAAMQIREQVTSQVVAVVERLTAVGFSGRSVVVHSFCQSRM